MDGNEMLRAMLLKLRDLSDDNLRQFSKDIPKVGLSDAREKWLLQVIETLLSLKDRHEKRGYIDGVILSNGLGPAAPFER